MPVASAKAKSDQTRHAARERQRRRERLRQASGRPSREDIRRARRETVRAALALLWTGASRRDTERALGLEPKSLTALLRWARRDPEAGPEVRAWLESTRRTKAVLQEWWSIVLAETLAMTNGRDLKDEAQALLADLPYLPPTVPGLARRRPLADLSHDLLRVLCRANAHTYLSVWRRCWVEAVQTVAAAWAADGRSQDIAAVRAAVPSLANLLQPT